jgi:hypothetical protein
MLPYVLYQGERSGPMYECIIAWLRCARSAAALPQNNWGPGWGTNKKATWYFAFFYPPNPLLLLFLHAFAHVLSPNPSLLVLAPEPEGKHPRGQKLGSTVRYVTRLASSLIRGAAGSSLLQAKS